jgi:uncharacterized membrane protein YkvA (DUF1232 family)
MKTHSNPSTPPLTEDPAREVCLRISAQSGALAEDPEFTQFIEHGTARLTPRMLAQMVAEMPDIREKFPELEAAGFPQTRAQLAFLADIVERSVLQDPLYCDLPCSAALEAAFALQYFHRAIDLIPDSLGALGYTDDAVVVTRVLARHGEAFEQLAGKLRRDWSTISPSNPPTR